MEMYALVLFDDGVYHCTKLSNVKLCSDKQYTAKWKSAWFNVQLTTGSEELCMSIKNSLLWNSPCVEIIKLDSSDVVGNNELNQCENESNHSLFYEAEINHLKGNFDDTAMEKQELSEISAEDSDSVNDPDYLMEQNSSSDSPNCRKPAKASQGDIENILVENSFQSEDPSKCSDDLVQSSEIDYLSISKDQSVITSTLSTSLGSANTSFVNIDEIQHSKNKSKKYFCIYCKKLVTKFGRHIIYVHNDENEVKKLLLLPKGCKERHEKIAEIRKNGNFLFNTKNAYNTGQLIVSRRPQQQYAKNANDYKVCPHCKGFYSKNAIRRHYIKCATDVIKGERSLSAASQFVHGQVHRKADNVLKNVIFPKFRDVDITRIIRYDELAIIYGNKLCTKCRKSHLHYFIRSKLRLIGRLMIELKKIDKSITDFASIFEPLYYDNVLKGINKVALFDDSLTYKSPATAFNYGTLLRKCGQILINEHIKSNNEVAQKKVKNFLLLQEDFANSVNKTVEENQQEQKRRKKVILPSTKDIKLLNQYLNKNRQKFYLNLKMNATNQIT